MVQRLVRLLLVIGAAPIASAQGSADILHYEFRSGSGDRVVNLGSFQGDAKIVKLGGQARRKVPGKPAGNGARDYALAGSEDGSVSKFCYLDTGWNGDLTGDLTIAWHMRRSSIPSPNAAYYVLSGMSNFRLYHHGNAYLGLKLRSWGGSPAELTLGTGTPGHGSGAFDVGAMSADNWLHFALVIDEGSQKAIFYLNGKAVKEVAINGGAWIRRSSSATFKVGMHLLTNLTSCYDLDNFRLSNRAVPAAEIARWAGATVFPDRFDVSRTGGTQKLTIDVGSAHAGRIYRVFGSATGGDPGITLNGLHLPVNYDVYTELTLFANPAIFQGFQGTLDSQGRATASIRFAPPGLPASFVGRTLLHSVLVVDPSGRWHTSANSTPLVIFP